MSLEVIGEATKNISIEFMEKHPGVGWRKIAGLRDKLIDHYFGVKWEIVRDVVKSEILKGFASENPSARKAPNCT